MPGSTLPNMSLQLGSIGGDIGTWGDLINAALGLIDPHDHTPGKGPRVPVAGLSIDADISMESVHGLKNTQRVAFAALGSFADNPDNSSVFVGSDHELYYRTSAGVNVKITNGSTLNVASFVGGIGGDYMAVSAALNYVDASQAYTFKGASGTNWARLSSGQLRLYETGTAESVYVQLTAPSALAASYSVTWPLATPGATSLLQMDNTGVLTASNTLSNTLTWNSSSATINALITASAGLTANGLITANSGITGTTITASGLITANAGVTAGANQSFTVSGTGVYKRPVTGMVGPAPSSTATVGSGSASTAAHGTTVAGTSQVYFPLPSVQNYCRVTGATVWFSAALGSSTTIRLYSTSSATPTGTTLSDLSLNASGTTSSLTITGGAVTPANGQSFYVRVDTGASSVTVVAVQINYDVP